MVTITLTNDVLDRWNQDNVCEQFKTISILQKIYILET